MELTVFIAELNAADQLVNATNDVCSSDGIRLQYDMQFSFQFNIVVSA